MLDNKAAGNISQAQDISPGEDANQNSEPHDSPVNRDGQGQTLSFVGRRDLGSKGHGETIAD